MTRLSIQLRYDSDDDSITKIQLKNLFLRLIFVAIIASSTTSIHLASASPSSLQESPSSYKESSFSLQESPSHKEYSFSTTPLCRLSNVYQNFMVLQRAPQVTNLYGFADPNTLITTIFRGTNLTSIASASGEWRQELPPTIASSITSSGETISFSCNNGIQFELNNILFGDVVLCGGQSNMQFTLIQISNTPPYNASEEIAATAAYPYIRTMTVGQSFTSYTPLNELGSNATLPWSIASPSTIGSGEWNATSAVCWFFGKALADVLQIPIGLISSNWGGTTIPCWSDTATNAHCNFPGQASSSSSTTTMSKKMWRNKGMKYGSSANTFATQEFISARDAGTIPDPNAGAGVLFNAMIIPFTKGPMSLSNIIWFQGESDLIDNWNSYEEAYGPLGTILPNGLYACQQNAMIQSWRTYFNSSNSFFGFVTIEPWLYPPPGIPGPLAEFRMAQLAALSLPNVGYASGVDIGDISGPYSSIHPRAKRAIGTRLANAALALNYGHTEITWKGPTYKSITTNVENGIITVNVTLNNVPTSLTLLNPPMIPSTPFCQAVQGRIITSDPTQCAWFTLFGDAGEVFNATSVSLTDDSKGIVLIATTSGKPNIIASSFGWGNWPVNMIYSSEGLPLEPWWCNSENACYGKRFS